MDGFELGARRLARTLAVAATAAAAMALSAGPAFADGNGASGWHVGYYTPSSPGTLSSSQAQSSTGNVAALKFTSQPNTALLYTDQKGSGLLGNDSSKSISAMLTVSGVDTAFIYGGEPSCGNPSSSVRFYFETSNAGGFNPGNYWWSNPTSWPLVTNGSGAIATTFDPSNWSDFYGINGAADTADFDNAVSDVTKIGLSFGGGCFFENGVGTTDGSGTFTLNTFNVN